METHESLYRDLQRHIDRMPVPFPETLSHKEIKILKHLFTPEEAEIALALSALPEDAHRINKRLKKLGFSDNELFEKLRTMELKGAIVGTVPPSGQEKKFSKAQLVIGMFEFQVDRISKEMTRDFEDYVYNEFREAAFNSGTKQMRTIPVEESLDGGKKVEPWDNIVQLVRENTRVAAVMNCVCRQSKEALGQKVAHPELEETCLTFGAAARWMVDKGIAHYIDNNEVMNIIEKAREAGFVLQPENARKPDFICCCNRECCHALGVLKTFERPADYVHSNFTAATESEKCSGCETCIGICPMEAISLVDGKAEVNTGRCIGCGNCVTRCDNNALFMVPREKNHVPPENHDTMYQQILKERFGFLGTLKVVAKAMIGMKI